jgi:hypothetical protein
MQGGFDECLETQLITHDIALPIHRLGKPSTTLRALLLSACDTVVSQQDELTQRIERLSLLEKDQHCVIVFLLHEKEDNNDGFAAYIGLQALYVWLRLHGYR